MENGSTAAASHVLEQLKIGNLTLLQLVRCMGRAFTDVDNILARKHAVGLIGRILQEEVVSLTALDVSTLEDFLVAKLSDWQCVDAAAEGLESLATKYDGNREKIAIGLFTVIPSNYSQPTRKTLLVLCEKILNDIHGLGYALGDGVLSLCDDERDPRNLLITFRLMQTVLELDSCISERSLEKYFDHLTSYFPVEFRPPKNDPHGITRKGLRAGLRATMGASHRLAHLIVPFLVLASKDALERGDEKRIKDCMKTLGTCMDRYTPTYVRSILSDIYALVSAINSTDNCLPVQVCLWRRSLTRAFADVPRGLTPDWLDNIQLHIDVAIPDLVACTASVHPSLYFAVWSVLEKCLHQHSALAERVFDAKIHSAICAQRQLDTVLTVVDDSTCGVAFKLLTTLKNQNTPAAFHKLVSHATASPEALVDALVRNLCALKLKLDAHDVLSWVRKYDISAPQRIRLSSPYLPESEDLLCAGVKRWKEDVNVLVACMEVMSEEFARSLSKWLDVWDIAVHYTERSDADLEAMRIVSLFAHIFIESCPTTVADALAQKVASEESLRNHPEAVLALLPQVASRAAPLSDEYLKMLVAVDANDINKKLEALWAVVSAMPDDARKALASRIDTPCPPDVRALFTRILLDDQMLSADHLSLVSSAVQDAHVLYSVLKHPIAGPLPPLIAQRLLFQHFASAPLGSKVVLLLCAAEADLDTFPVRETILMAVEDELDDSLLVHALHLLMRIDVKSFAADMDSVVPALARLTKRRLPITRFAALQVLDKILHTVDVRYTAPVRKQLNTCFGDCTNDRRRTVRSFAAAAYSRALIMNSAW